MNDKFQIGQCLGHQLEKAFARNGWPIKQVSKLTKGDVLGKFLDVLNGKGIIIPIIDCNAAPFLPNDSKIVKHRKGGQLKWIPEIIELYLDESQWNGQGAIGHKLRQKLAGKRVLNANVLDFLLVHPELIPEEWKGKRVCFWGTIYHGNRFGGGPGLYVRYLYWNGVRWHSNALWLVNKFYDSSPAAICKPAYW